MRGFKEETSDLHACIFAQSIRANDYFLILNIYTNTL
jgi:hypothetical protein